VTNETEAVSKSHHRKSARYHRWCGWPSCGSRCEPKYIDSNLVIAALYMAVKARRPDVGLLVHTDRGSQYSSREYRAYIAAHGIIASMSRKGNCWDNAVAESFFSTLKVELKPKHVWATRSEAQSAIFEYIEVWYNRERRHSSIQYLSPAGFEASRLVA
jgi:putative transposase